MVPPPSIDAHANKGSDLLEFSDNKELTDSNHTPVDSDDIMQMGITMDHMLMWNQSHPGFDQR